MSDNNSESLKEEVDAIGVVLERLAPLSGPSRERVIEYVVGALDIGIRMQPSQSPQAVPIPPSPAEPAPGRTAGVLDIRTLRETKNPSSAVEMAAVVGYYLAELTGEGRKDNVEASDIERLFKQAGFPLPSRLGNVLPNAAAAGYFDSVERGRYRLNPVGYNLVAHNLPAGRSNDVPGKRAPRKAAAKKGGAKKSAAKSRARKPGTRKSRG